MENRTRASREFSKSKCLRGSTVVSSWFPFPGWNGVGWFSLITLYPWPSCWQVAAGTVPPWLVSIACVCLSPGFRFPPLFRPTLSAKTQSNKNLSPGATDWKYTKDPAPYRWKNLYSSVKEAPCTYSWIPEQLVLTCSALGCSDRRASVVSVYQWPPLHGCGIVEHWESYDLVNPRARELRGGQWLEPSQCLVVKNACIVGADSVWFPMRALWLRKKQGFQKAPVSSKKDSGVRRTQATSPVLQSMGHVSLKQVT